MSMDMVNAADNIVGEIANLWEGARSSDAGQLWRSLWTLASPNGRETLMCAALEQDAEHPETAGRMPWAGDVAAWAADVREGR